MTARPTYCAALVAALALVLSSLMGITAATAATPALTRALDMNCSDFSTQAEAQNYFVNHGGPNSDPDGLDSEGDGIACETLPCPCSYSTGGGGGGTGQSTGGGSKGTKKATRQTVRVVKVYDGDSIKVRLPSGAKRWVEGLGYSSPTTTDCAGPEAKASLQRLLPKGSKLILVSDPTQPDKLKKSLYRYLVKPSGKDVGRVQLKRGWADLWFANNKNFQRIKPYRKALTSAKASGRGFWGSGCPRGQW